MKRVVALMLSAVMILGLFFRMWQKQRKQQRQKKPGYTDRV